jgi:RNA exonuclease 1
LNFHYIYILYKEDFLSFVFKDSNSLSQLIDGESDVTNETSTASSEESPKQKRIQRNRKIIQQNFIKQRSGSRNQNQGKMNRNQVENQQNKAFEKHEQDRFRALEPPLRQHIKLNLTEEQLIHYLKNYLLDETFMRLLGFPVEYDVAPNLAIIYKYPPYEYISQKKHSLQTLINNESSIIVNANDGLIPTKENFGSELNDGDSGQESGSSSPSEDFEIKTSQSVFKSLFLNHKATVGSQKECARCGKGFFVTNGGEYVTKEHCFFHWGKVNKFFDGYKMRQIYSCCNRESNENGCRMNACSSNRFHVWTGLESGLNGPYEGFVRTKRRLISNPPEKNAKVFALDCEMCFTGCGLELTKVSIIRSDGNLFYESFVRPERDIVDYNTRFSGITEKDLSNIANHNYKELRRASVISNSSSSSTSSNRNTKTVKTLKQVQIDLLKFIFEDTILIGHSIENDLKALKLIHKTIIDTSVLFPHYYGLPYRRSLKSLTKSILKRDIQQTESGHCSFEDSRACLELTLWKVRKDFRTLFEHN